MLCAAASVVAAIPLVVAAPAAATAPAAVTQAGAVSAATRVLPAGERNPKVSRSLRGVLPSAYVGRHYSPRHESTRRCIVRRESGGNYRISSPGGRYRGAYQFNPGLARTAAKRMGRSDLVGRPINTWSRFEQDKAFWVIWDHGRGRGHWASTRHRC
jgi:hypothetical protein